MAIDIVCAKCGSRDVRCDATAGWNPKTQEWELVALQDQGYCESCGGEAKLKEEPLCDVLDTTQIAVVRSALTAAVQQIEFEIDRNYAWSNSIGHREALERDPTLKSLRNAIGLLEGK